MKLGTNEPVLFFGLYEANHKFRTFVLNMLLLVNFILEESIEIHF